MVALVVISIILLGFATALFGCIRSGENAAAAVLFVIVGVVSMCLGPWAPALWTVLSLLAVIANRIRLTTRGYVALGVFAPAALVLVIGLSSVAHSRRMRAELPIESLSARLAYEQRSLEADVGGPVIAGSTESQLHSFEESLNLEPGWRRIQALQLVHASWIEQFVNADGFGVGRILRNSPALARFDRRRDNVPQTKPAEDAALSEQASNHIGADRDPSTQRAIALIHSESQLDFATFAKNGYVQDVDHVAGFVPHHFTDLPDRMVDSPMGLPALYRVELVSLLKHDPPGVYVSENLPDMEELRDAPVRPLDAFEQRALARLRAGEDLVAADLPDVTRALGSLRAARQCLQCHSVPRGELLGAFSYVFELPQDAAKRPQPPTVEPPGT